MLDLIVVNGYLVNQYSGTPRHVTVYVREHGEVPDGWEIHHIDGDKLHNELENLIAIPAKLHARIHENYRHKDLPKRERIGEWLRYGYIPERDGVRKKRQGSRTKDRKATERRLYQDRQRAIVEG